MIGYSQAMLEYSKALSELLTCEKCKGTGKSCDKCGTKCDECNGVGKIKIVYKDRPPHEYIWTSTLCSPDEIKPTGPVTLWGNLVFPSGKDKP
jgi:RecJ-like exonuclease